MNVLVTGAAGFIGSHLTDLLLVRGDRVVGIDDLSTGNIQNLASAFECKRFTFVRGDIRDPEVVARVMQDCDAVVHLAARIGMRAVVESPLETLEINARGAELILLEASRRALPTVTASTSEVYGYSTRIPSAESDPIAFGSPTVGRWSYACAKAYDEFYALALHRERGLPVAVARLFNTVGSRQTGRYGMVIPRFVAQAQRGEPLTVYGDGTQTRCFCSVNDAAGALVTMLDRMSEVAGEVYNVGNPQEMTILELAQRVIARTNSSSSIRFVPFSEAYPSGFEEIMRRVPDISKARAAFGFNPRTTLDQVLESVIENTRPEQISA
jgi:UDP-glucose 4-epimerase